MKEMQYQRKRIIEILENGRYNGFNSYILNLGTHPTAYIEIPKNHKLFNKTYEEIYNIIDLEVHYGLTYSRNYLYIDKDKKLKGWFIGWDYAHCDDYDVYDEIFPENIRTNGKKWTTEEIFEEVKTAINQLKEMK